MASEQQSMQTCVLSNYSSNSLHNPLSATCSRLLLFRHVTLYLLMRFLGTRSKCWGLSAKIFQAQAQLSGKMLDCPAEVVGSNTRRGRGFESSSVLVIFSTICAIAVTDNGGGGGGQLRRKERSCCDHITAYAVQRTAWQRFYIRVRSQWMRPLRHGALKPNLSNVICPVMLDNVIMVLQLTT